MAFFSRLDGSAQEYELFVPPAYRASATTRWPLVVTLHGLEGNAGDYFRNTFGLARDRRRYPTMRSHGRHGPAPTEGTMLVIAPTGRGQAFYRHAGEVDVLEAIADVRRRFPLIDEDRIYITGGSMGGTGAAFLPYRHPDLFAASAALAGYHHQRIRADTRHDGLSPVEHFLEAHRSDVDWAENGANLPMLLVRGVHDRPLEWTRCLVRRLNQLGYSCEHREPQAGHNVWDATYADGAIFDWFSQYRRPSHPRHVVLRTARERTRESFWVRVDEREAPDVFAEVDAEIDNGVIAAQIQGAKAVTFDPAPPLVTAGAPIVVRIGSSRIEGAAPLTIERMASGWQRATQPYPTPGARRPGLDGPIREVFDEPLTFVVGTHDPDHTFINRLVAEHWARPPGWIVDYPIVDDVDVTDAMIRQTVLVLIGPPSSNSVLARIADRLPIRVGDDAIRVGSHAHRGDNVGSVFVAPNPLAPDHLVLVIAGPEPLGTFRSIQLPDILPDYVVYDEHIAPARDRWACGGTGCRYRAHGFFDMRWRLPARAQHR
jgi:predicted esterase